jgi:hypothetical protein
VLKERRAAAAGLVLSVAAGLSVRAATGGTFADVAGVILYATAVYSLVLLIRPRTSVGPAAAIALAWCWAIELAQLTPGPAAVSSRSLIGRLILGSTFTWSDMVAYPLGVLLAVGIRLAWAGRRQEALTG